MYHERLYVPTRNDVELRFADERDLTQLAALERQCFGSLALGEPELREVLHEGWLLVGVHPDGGIVALSELVRGHSSLRMRIPSQYLFSLGTCVSPDFRGSGLGAALVHAQKEVVRRAHMGGILTSTQYSNAASLRLRLRACFQIVGYSEEVFLDCAGDPFRLLLRWVSNERGEILGQTREIDLADASAKEELCRLLDDGWVGCAIDAARGLVIRFHHLAGGESSVSRP